MAGIGRGATRWSLLADASTVCGVCVVSPGARRPMTFRHAERLCRALMSADSGDAAVAVLRRAGYWDDPGAWRPLGDNPGNLSIVANQQSDPVAALAEKLTNAVDARLINACWAAGAAGGPAWSSPTPSSSTLRSSTTGNGGTPHSACSRPSNTRSATPPPPEIKQPDYAKHRAHHDGSRREAGAGLFDSFGLRRRESRHG